MSEARSAGVPAPAVEAPTTESEHPEIDSLLEVVDTPPANAVPVTGMRSATLLAVDRDGAKIRLRSKDQALSATLGPGVERELLRHALDNGDTVLVECDPGTAPVIVGVLMTKLPRKLELKAEEIHIEAEQELVLRSGRAALRMRQDGNVELVGTRISAASRGLFKLVGRMLRLN